MDPGLEEFEIHTVSGEMRLGLLLSLSFALFRARADRLDGGPVLLFTEHGVLQFVLAVSVPLTMNKKGPNVGFTMGFQFNYDLPWNVSQLEPKVIPARRKRGFDLWEIYTTLESEFERHGWKNGKDCLLRSICELAEIPLDRNEKGDVLQEVMHLILTPSEDLPEDSVDESYREAERWGKSGADCILRYPECNESPLEAFTDVVFS